MALEAKIFRLRGRHYFRRRVGRQRFYRYRGQSMLPKCIFQRGRFAGRDANIRFERRRLRASRLI